MKSSPHCGSRAHTRDGSAPGAAAVTAVGRPTPARRDRPRHSQGAQGVPVRRTAIQSRRRLRARTRVELAELHQRLKSTMIYVTHDQVEAMTLADRIVVLNNCRIEQIGTPMEVYPQPASRFVAGFVGSPAMNFLPVTLSGSGDRPHARSPTGRRAPAGRTARQGLELGVRPEALSVVAEGGETNGNRQGRRTARRAHTRPRAAPGRRAGHCAGSGPVDRRARGKVRLEFDTTALHLFGSDGTAWHAAQHPVSATLSSRAELSQKHAQPLMPAESVIASVTRRWNRR